MSYIFEILVSIFLFFLTILYNKIVKKLQMEREHNKFISEGVQALLREQIINNFNKYQERGECPIYAKESATKLYKAYHSLGGNGMITEIYDKLMDMEERKK